MTPTTKSGGRRWTPPRLSSSPRRNSSTAARGPPAGADGNECGAPTPRAAPRRRARWRSLSLSRDASRRKSPGRIFVPPPPRGSAGNNRKRARLGRGRDFRSLSMPNIQDARILTICTDGVEQVELTTPRDELRKKGAWVDVATPTGRPVRAWKFTDWGDSQPADLKISDVNPDNYDALVIPGG